LSSLELKPRLASEIVDAAFQLYRKHFSELVTMSALCFAPYILIQLVATGGNPEAPEAGISTMIPLIVGGWLFGSFLEAAIVVAVSNSYLRGAPDPPGALRHTLSRFGAVLLSITAKWFMIGLGFVLAFLMTAVVAALALTVGGNVTPGSAGVALFGALITFVLFLVAIPVALYFFASYFAVPATVVLEGLGVRAGLRRSRELAQGFRKKIFGALGLPLLGWLILQLTLTGVLMLLPGPPVIAFLVDQAATVLAYPIIAVIATLLYYDARIRKEGFDIEVMASELGMPANIDSTAPPAPSS
jgi:hypothetical protein